MSVKVTWRNHILGPGLAGALEQFSSSWATDTGTTLNALNDGGAWNESEMACAADILEVVPATGLSYPGPGSNLFRIEVDGTLCRNIESFNEVPRGETMFVRFLIRFDAGDNVSGTNHFFVHDIHQYRGAYISPSSSGYTSGFWGMKFQCDSPGPVTFAAGNPYPYGAWYMTDGLLQQGVWYEVVYELRIVGTEETDPAPVGTGQPGTWPRTNAVEFQPYISIYDTSGVLVADQNDMRCQDYGGNGVSIAPHGESWDLGQWNTEGRNFLTGNGDTAGFTDQIDIFRRFSLGNNGQDGQAAGSGTDYIYIGDFGIYTNEAPPLIASDVPDIIDNQFSEGVSGLWTGAIGGGDIALVPDPTGSFGGRQVSRHRFSINSGSHVDQDIYRYYDGYADPEVYVAIDVEFTSVSTPSAQRKLIYLKGDRDYSGYATSWTVILTAYIPNIYLGRDDHTGDSAIEIGAGLLAVDTPYRFELGVRVNDAGASNGWIRVWLTDLSVGAGDRTLIYEVTNMQVDVTTGGTHDPYPDRIQIGDQLDNGIAVGSLCADDRIFDRMMISSSEIGTHGLGA